MEESKILFGIWIPGTGWLKGKDVFADESYNKAQQVAHLIGRGAKVYYIDKSIVDFEQHYLEQERRSVWRKIKNILMPQLSSNSKKTIPS